MYDEKQFWDNVAIKGENDCWEWKGAMWRNGYGQVYGWRKVTRYAHRLSYILANGAIPDGLHICHSCDNKKCVNPKHLWAGTNNDNRQDSVKKKRHYHGERVSIAIRGENHPLHRLTEQQVLEIRKDYSSGMIPKLIKQKYNITSNMVSKIIYRRTWCHI